MSISSLHDLGASQLAALFAGAGGGKRVIRPSSRCRIPVTDEVYEELVDRYPLIQLGFKRKGNCLKPRGTLSAFGLDGSYEKEKLLARLQGRKWLQNYIHPMRCTEGRYVSKQQKITCNALTEYLMKEMDPGVKLGLWIGGGLLVLLGLIFGGLKVRKMVKRSRAVRKSNPPGNGGGGGAAGEPPRLRRFVAGAVTLYHAVRNQLKSDRELSLPSIGAAYLNPPSDDAWQSFVRDDILNRRCDGDEGRAKSIVGRQGIKWSHFIDSQRPFRRSNGSATARDVYDIARSFGFSEAEAYQIKVAWAARAAKGSLDVNDVSAACDFYVDLASVATGASPSSIDDAANAGYSRAFAQLISNASHFAGSGMPYVEAAHAAFLAGFYSEGHGARFEINAIHMGSALREFHYIPDAIGQHHRNVVEQWEHMDGAAAEGEGEIICALHRLTALRHDAIFRDDLSMDGMKGAFEEVRGICDALLSDNVMTDEGLQSIGYRHLADYVVRAGYDALHEQWSARFPQEECPLKPETMQARYPQAFRSRVSSARPRIAARALTR